MSRTDRIRVLHVDDDPSFVETAATFIEREDERMTVETATSASEGLDRLASGDIDCVVSDYDMPGLNGIEFLEAVREEYADLPFILYTGKGSEEIASEAISAGVSDYLQKGTGTDQYALLVNRIETTVDKNRAETEVETTQHRYQRLIEATSDVIVIVDADGMFRYLGPSVEHILGYGQRDLVGESIFESVHPEDRERTVEKFQELLDYPDQRVTVEYRFQRADGTWIWLEARGRNLRDDPVIDGIVVHAREVTERKDREQRLSDLLDATRDLILASDFEGIADRIVDAADRVIGLEAAAFLEPGDGPTLSPVATTEGAEDLFDHELRTDSRDTLAWSAYESGESLVVDDVREHGEVRDPAAPIRSEIAIPLGESGVFLAGSTSVGALDDTDVTLSEVLLSNAEAAVARTEHETLLRERERKLDRLQDRTQQLMYTKNRTETARVAVEAASDVLGASLNGVHLVNETGDTLEGVVMTDAAYDRYGETLNYSRDHDPGSSDAVVWDVFERDEPLLIDDTHEYEPLTEEPLSRCVLVYPVGSHGVFIASRTEPNAFDETDQALFDVLATSLTGALDRVEREKTLRERNEQLERQNERLDEFASIVSHDLRNPLKVATGRLALLREDCESDHIDPLARAHDRMETLIDDLLTLARSGQSAGDTEPVDLQEIVERGWRTVETDAATLVVEANGTIRADPTRLRQLLENLFQNSVEHGSTGSRPEADDSVEHGSTSPDSQAQENGVTVTVGPLPDGFYVADDGRGVPAEHRDRIFESGYSTTPEGTGFGMAIVRQVARAHDWQIHLTESDDGGARFEITGVEFV